MSCVYVYNGKEYSRVGIINAIKNGDVIAGNIDQARSNLERILGMPSEDIELVAGLIQQDAVGALMKDGRILLSTAFIDGDEYHEAFHRVFRMLVDDTQRQALLSEYSKREGAEQAIKNKQAEYNISRDGAIEELLAEEFMMYQLNDGNYVVPAPIESLFDRIIRFVKKMLGIQDIKGLYEEIAKGGYKYKPILSYPSNVAKSKVKDIGLDIATKDEIIEAVSALTMERVFMTGDIDAIFGSKSLETYVAQAVVDVLETLIDTNPSVATTVYKDMLIRLPEAEAERLGTKVVYNSESVLIDELFKRLEQLGIKGKLQRFESEPIQLETSETTQESKVLGEEELSDSDEAVNDHAFMKMSWEYDPKQGITRPIKLMIASIVDDFTSPILGVAKLVNYDTVISTLFRELSQVPPIWESVEAHLRNKTETHPWLNKVLERLGVGNEDMTVSNFNLMRLRNQFMNSFVNNHYPMFTFKWDKDGTLQVQPADEITYTQKALQEVKNYVQQFDAATLREFANTKNYNQFFQDVFDIDISKLDHNEILNGTSIGDRLQYIKRGVEDILNNDGTGEDFFKSKFMVTAKGKKPRDVAFLSNLRIVLGRMYKDAPMEQLVVLNHQGNRVFPFTQHTYQTQVAGILNYIVEQTSGTVNPITGQAYAGRYEQQEQQRLESRIELLRRYAPNLVNTFNFKEITDEETGMTYLTPRSEMLRQLFIFNNKYTIGINLGMTSRDDVDAKNLQDTDLITQTMRAARSEQGMFMSVKHGDRGNLFVGQYANRYQYVDRSEYENMRGSFVDYLMDTLQDEVRFAVEEASEYDEFKNMGQSKLLLFDFLNTSPEKLHQMTSDQLDRFARPKLEAFADKVFKDFKDYMKEYGLTDEDGKYLRTRKTKTKPSRPVFLSAEYGAELSDDKIDQIVAHAVFNHGIHFVEETRVLVGLPSQFNSVADYFKRIQSLSSSGKPLINDELTNSMINALNNRPFKIAGETIPGYGRRDLKSKGLVTESVVKAPVLSSRNVENLAKIFEAGLQTEGLSAEVISQRVQEWKTAYENYEEADGVTHANIFFVREYNMAKGTWSKDQENAFQVELAVLGLERKKNIRDTVVYYHKDVIVAYPSENDVREFTSVRIFDYSNPVVAELWESIGSLTMHKPIYAGYVERNGKHATAVRKTAIHPLIPSMVRGTVLEDVNNHMIKQGIDLRPADSASKVGAPTLMSDFYILESEVTGLTDRMYWKEQVPVSNEPKRRIKNATQSVKILLQNAFENGLPRDFKDSATWSTMTEDQKREASPLYDKVQNYVESLYEVLDMHKQDFLDELNATESSSELVVRNLSRIAELFRSNTDAPHILDAIDLFLETPYIDLLPNYRKLESILFSMVSNSVIHTLRPGDLKVQYAVTGLEKKSDVVPGMASPKLKFYEPVFDENGKLKRLNPAEIIYPLEKSMIDKLLRKTGTTNIVDAIETYRKMPDYAKFKVKGLRIPNQQMSFNGAYIIKEFTLPTFQSFIVLPSESVPQSSTDFDLDKQQIYFPVLDDKGLVIEDHPYNKLLSAELDLLLSVENAHHLLAPVNEDWMKNDLFKKVMVFSKEFTSKQFDEQRDTLTIPMKFADMFNPARHLRTSVAMTQSKLNVGPIATNITLHAVAARDGWEAKKNADGSYTRLPGFTSRFKRFPTSVSAKLPLVGQTYKLGNLYDSQGRHITEVLSTLLTSQLDGIKDNYAVMMNIVDQTIPPVVLAVRRGVPVDLVLKLIKTQGVSDYIKQLAIQESITYQAGNIRSVLEATIRELGYDYEKLLFNINQMAQGRAEITDKVLNDISKGKAPQEQAIAAYIYLSHAADQFLNHALYSRPDTQRLRSMTMLENIERSGEDLVKERAVEQMPQQGFFSKFFEMQELYRKLADQFYILRKKPGLQPFFKRDGVLDKFTDVPRSRKNRDRYRRIAESDLMASLIVRNNDVGFDALFKGSESLASRVDKIKRDDTHPLHNNYLIQHLNPILTTASDPFDGSRIHLLRLNNRGATPLHYHNVLSAFKTLPEDMQKDLLFVSIFQGGMDYSPFSLDEAIEATFKLGFTKPLADMSISESEVQQLSKNLLAWNPEILNYQHRDSYARGYKVEADYILHEGQTYPLLGTKLVKRYDKDLESKEIIRIQNREDSTSSEPSMFDDSDPLYRDMSELKTKADETLDGLLTDMMRNLNIETQVLDDIKERFGFDSLGVADLLNKTISLAKNRNIDTMSEEVAHFIIALAGDTNRDVVSLLQLIEKWSGYEDVYRQYMPVYNDENKVKLEAAGKLIAQAVVKNYQAYGTDLSLLEQAREAVINILKELYDLFFKGLLGRDFDKILFNSADKIALDILSGTLVDTMKSKAEEYKNYSLVNIDEAFSQNPEALKVHRVISSSGVTYLTGSLALSVQGTTYREGTNLVHDLDYRANLKDLDKILQLQDKLKKEYGAVEVYDMYDNDSGGKQNALLVPKEGYSVEVLQRVSNSGKWKNRLYFFTMKDEQGNEVQPKQGENFTTVDFFIVPEVKMFGEFTSWDDVFSGKFSMGSNPYTMSRLKDTADLINFERNNVSIARIEEEIKKLEKQGELKIDCSGSIKAADGLRSSFTRNSQWQIVKDLKGYPSHEKGGVDIQIGKDGFSFTRNQSVITANYGLVLPKISNK